LVYGQQLLIRVAEMQRIACACLLFRCLQIDYVKAARLARRGESWLLRTSCRAPFLSERFRSEANMTSNTDIQRYAALGRAFDNCLEGLTAEEKHHLARNPPTAKDVRQSALNSLALIGAALQEVKRLKLSQLSADHLPGPLEVLTRALLDVQKGRKSAFLMPDSVAKDMPVEQAARSSRKAHAKAFAIEVYSRLRKAGWTVPKASSEIATIFQETGEKDIKPGTITEWGRQSRKNKTKDTGLVLDERAALREALEDFDRQEFQVTRKSTSIEIEPSPVIGYDRMEVAQSQSVESFDFWEEDRCEVLLDSLRRYIAGTSFKT
jgi:hypothetical protein